MIKKELIVMLVIFILVDLGCSKSSTGPSVSSPVSPFTSYDFASILPEIGEYGEDGLHIYIDLPANSEALIDSVEYWGIKYKANGYGGNYTKESTEIDSTHLSIVLDDNLIEDLEYSISAFISIDGLKLYSASDTITVKETYPSSPWGLGLSSQGSVDKIYGMEINGEAYIISCFGYFYKIENHKWVSKNPFTLNGTTGISHATFSIGEYGYVKSSGRSVLRRYDPVTDSWEAITATSFYTDEHLGAQLNGMGYIFDRNDCYKYNPELNIVTEFSNYDGHELINTFQTDTAIYAINSLFEILKFNEMDGTWEYLTTYPGNHSEWIVSFIHNDKAYIGLSSRYHYPGHENFNDMYELDLNTLEFRELSPFPYVINNSWTIINVSLNDYCYMVYQKSSYSYSSYVWKFEPDEIIYSDSVK